MFTYTIVGECDVSACNSIGLLGETLHGNEATITITIYPPGYNPPPGEFYPTLQAFDKQVATDENGEAQIQLQGSTSTIDFEYFITLDPVNGTITSFDPVTGKVNYTATVPGATSDMFTYTIYGECEGDLEDNLACLFIGHLGDTLHGNEATVTITITAPYCGEFDSDNDGIGNLCDETPNGDGGSVSTQLIDEYANKILEKLLELNGVIPDDNLSG